MGDTAPVAALVTYSYADSFFYREYAQELSRCLNDRSCSLLVLDGCGSAEVQISAVEALIVKGVDAIIIDPVDPASLDDAVAQAMQSDIKTLLVGKVTHEYDAFVKCDHFSSGYKLGAAAASWIRNNISDTAKVALLVGPDLTNLRQRELGIIQALGDIAPNAEVVYSSYAISQAAGFTVTETILRKTPDIDAVLCVNDDGALGALEAAHCFGLSPEKFFLGSVDGTTISLEKVKNDPLYSATVSLSITRLANDTADVVRQLIDGESPDKPSLRTMLVDKYNIDKYYVTLQAG